MLKPLFDIQRLYVDGSRFCYEIYYKHDKSYSKVVDASFLTLRAAKEYINEVMGE